MKNSIGILILAWSVTMTRPLIAAELLDAEAVWRPEVEELYSADVYHSKSAALQFLARDLEQRAELSEGDVAFSFEQEGQLIEELAAAMKDRGLKIEEDGFLVRLSLESDGDRQLLRLSCDVNDSPFLTTAEFENEAWVSETHPDSDLAVVRGVICWTDSTGPAACSSSRDEVAISLAVKQHILPRIFEHPKLRLRSNWERNVAARRVRKELQHSPIITDRFQQTFYKTIGDERHEAFAREALLLDLSEENMADIVRSVRHDVRRGKRIRSGAFSFAAIVIGVTCFVCWVGHAFFNRVTRGYYVWPIRFVTAVVLLTSLTLAAGITFSILKSL